MIYNYKKPDIDNIFQMGNQNSGNILENYQMRQAYQAELSVFVQTSDSQSWATGKHDVMAAYRFDPQTFQVGLFNHQIVTMMSLIIYDEYHAFLGYVICKPHHRKKKYTITLAKKTFSRLSSQNVGLDAAISQVPTYQRNGFKIEYTNLRHQIYGTRKQIINKSIVPIAEVDFDELVNYDTEVFPSKRPLFLKQWISMKDSITVAYLQNNKIVGFGQLRKNVKGYYIGPLFADNLQIGTEIFQYLRSKVEQDSKIVIDIPDINGDAMKLISLYELTQVLKVPRMYTKGLPKINYKKIYAITSDQFG